MSDTGAIATVGRPSARVAPATRQIAVTSIAGATSGAINRFASGATSESRPNWSRISGSVAACAARDTDSASTSQAGRMAGNAPRQPFVQRRCPGQEAGSRHCRKLETNVVDSRGVEREQSKASDGEGGLRLAAASGFPCDNHRRGHQCRAKDARRRAGQDRVTGDRQDNKDRTRPARQSAQQRCNDRAKHRDVPAADGHDVAQPGCAEVVADLSRDHVAQSDRHGRGQTGLWLRQHAVDQVVGAASEALKGGKWRVVAPSRSMVRALSV